MRRWLALLLAVVAIGVATWWLTRSPAPVEVPAASAPVPPPSPVVAPVAVEVAIADAGDEDDDGSKTVRLAGVVVDRGQLVEGATVTVPFDHDEATAVSDAQGHFEVLARSITNEDGEAELDVQARKDERFGAISVRTARDRLDLRLELEGTGTLRVSLRDPDGVPIRDGEVDAVGDLGTDTSNVNGPPQIDFSERSDGHGDAVLHVRPDTYWITATWTGGETEQRTGVKVALGAETHVTLKFRRYSLKGHVLNRAGEPVVDAQLVLYQHGAKVSAGDDDELSGDDGAFSYVGLPPGAYDVYATHGSEGAGHATLHVPNLDAKVIVESASDISGRVEDERGAPQGEFWVSAVSGRTQVSTRASEAGEFRLSCPPGTYEVTATADDQHGDDRSATVQVKLAAHGHELVRVVVPAARPLSGVVVDVDGVPQAKVLVQAMPPGARRARVEDFTRKDGRFSFESLSGAEYTLVASGRDLANVEKVVAHPGETNVRLVVEKQPRVEGRVVDGAGKPVTHFFVNGQGFDAADGRFSVAPWQDVARMPLYLDADAVGEAVYAVAPKKHGVTEVGDLALSTLHMRVTVLDAKRRPLAGTSFHFQLDGAPSGLFMGDPHKHHFLHDADADGRLDFPIFFSDGFVVNAFTHSSGKIDGVIMPKATELELVGGPEWVR